VLDPPVLTGHGSGRGHGSDESGLTQTGFFKTL
jgi:hypothetical protein